MKVPWTKANDEPLDEPFERECRDCGDSFWIRTQYARQSYWLCAHCFFARQPWLRSRAREAKAAGVGGTKVRD